MSPDVVYADLARLAAEDRAAGRKHAKEMKALEAKRGAGA